MNDVILPIGAFLVLLGLLVALRIKSNAKLEIKTPDIVLALVPIALWLFLTGRITKFEYGDLKIETAFAAASQTAVADEVTDLAPLPVEEIDTEAKGGVGRIPELVARKTSALSFRLGGGGYWGPAIEEYFRVLSQYPFFKYIVIQEQDGSFFGLADAHRTADMMADRRLDARLVAEWLNQGNGERLAQELPGFIEAASALPSTAGRREALEQMDRLEAESLPVVDGSGSFAGIVQRSRLTASMLIDIAKRLE